MLDALLSKTTLPPSLEISDANDEPSAWPTTPSGRLTRVVVLAFTSRR